MFTAVRNFGIYNFSSAQSDQQVKAFNNTAGVELISDVEAVKYVERGRQAGGNDVEISFPRVGADNLDMRAAL